MRKTLFAGLTQLDPLDPLSTDEYSFQSVNPDITDRLLEVGAVTHRHDGHAALANPLVAPDAVVASGGNIPPGVTFEFAYTLIDADRGETAASPIDSVTTPDGLTEPLAAPVAVADYLAGTLAADTYYYATTWVDADGGETTLGAIEVVDVDPAVNAEVVLTGLSVDMVSVGAAGWRLYRARGGEAFRYLATGTSDTITDDGTLCPNCQQSPPEFNTTQGTNRLLVTIPAIPSGAVGGWRLYGTVTSGVWSAFSYVASGIAPATVELLNFSPTYGRPPTRSLALRGASLIDPDTELLDWHWKRPVDTFGDLPAVGNASGDVRLTEELGTEYTWLDEVWTPVRSQDRTSHTFAIMGDVTVGSGQVGGIPGFFVGLPDGRGGRVGRITEVWHRLGVGSATVSLRVAGSVPVEYDNTNVAGVTNNRFGDVAVENGDLIELLVDSVSGSPQNLSFSVFIDTG